MKNNYNEFHGNYTEDKWIVDNVLDLPDNGIFVDVGAADAIKRSNTYHFEKNGWKGLCIEGDPFFFKDESDDEGPNNSLTRYRENAINAVISETDGELEFMSRGRHSLSQVWNKNHFPTSAHEKVPCYRLDTILEKYNWITEIDILDICTRGHDFEVWSSFDYKKYNPKIIITELNRRGPAGSTISDERVYNFLINEAKYKLVHSTSPDLIFIHPDVRLK
mgnify:CR=1 FL=1